MFDGASVEVSHDLKVNSGNSRISLLAFLDMAKQLVTIEYVRSGKNMPPRKSEPFRKQDPPRSLSQSPSMVQAMIVGIKVE
jgi:hypothetical protein